MVAGLVAWALIASTLAGAQSRSCASPTETVRVAAVVDDLDLALEDGRTLRLAGLDPARATPTHPDLGEAARRDLESRVVGQDVIVALLEPKADRWERWPALVSKPGAPGAGEQPGSTSINESLVANGWARARPEIAARSCLAAFLAIEAGARSAGLGLWADPYYAVVDADDGKGLAARAGAMALVEGRLRVREARGRVYLRLGGTSSNFAGTVGRDEATKLARNGLALKSLDGSRLRIRGFLDDRFGPRIDVTDIGQIEVLRTGGAERPGEPGGLPADAETRSEAD